MPLTPVNVYGVLSLVFWALVIVVTLKYVMFVMRADNEGEGGILALVALIQRKKLTSGAAHRFFVTSGVFGAALFFGIAMITPALSVLSATEGLKVISPSLDHWVLPLALGILLALFSIQSRGTSSMGAMFGPVMMGWFSVLAVLGIISIIKHPGVLAALNPWYAIAFFIHNGLIGFLVIGAVVLAVTGGEALYADMGHFGRVPIQMAWLGFVMPALVLNYFGQGALLLYEPEAIDNPFFHLAPEWFQIPLFIMSTAATIIASQAVITGVFSVTRQAVQLGFWPRTHILHTSEKEIGQIYVPQMNRFLLVSVIALVLIFRSSSNLATAYGIAVTAEMMVTTFLACVVALRLWAWNKWAVLVVGLVFFSVDAFFLGSNMLKFFKGGWVPVLIGVVISVLMLIWRNGRRVLHEKVMAHHIPLSDFVNTLEQDMPAMVPGTAVFMNSNLDSVPHALLHNLKHNKVIHERVIFLTVETEDVPFVPRHQRIEIKQLSEHFYAIRAHYGFKESPDVPELLEQSCAEHGLSFNMMETSFFLSRERLIPAETPSMPLPAEYVFSTMARNAMNATDFFNIPANRVVELGAQIEI
jgi:KUP system potassium uptake protein